jgi:signal transduction histidine kinase
LTLRTEISLVLSSLLIVSIGVAGGASMYQTNQTLRRELRIEYQLFAETRAFALRDNLVILEGELARLALLPQFGPEEGALKAASQVLASAHQNSVLYNTAVLMLSADGRCVEAEPEVPEYQRQSFGDRPWFRQVASGDRGPLLRATDEPALGRTIKIVQPITRGGVFAGALVGIVSLEDANLITPALRENLPPQTDSLMIDSAGVIVFPSDRAVAGVGTDWARIIQSARGGSPGTAFGEAAGEEVLFAWAPVEAHSGYIVVFAWPWRVLNVNLRKQIATLVGVLIFGILLASLTGLALSTYLTRPLEALGISAARIASGTLWPDAAFPTSARATEVAALIAGFQKMETAIRQRDQALREGASLLEQRVADRTGELVATQRALVEAERFAAMGKTSAAIAHEIKNALNGLGMAVELILQDPTNQTRGQRLQRQVVGEIARLRDVIDSLLSFSRTPRIERTEVDLVPVVRAAVRSLAEIIADRRATVRIELPDSLPLVCDGHKIQGVLLNLLKNAVESGQNVRVRGWLEGAPVDSASVGGDVAPVTRAPRSPVHIVIEVSDDGPGLSAEARLHLFEPFFTTKPNGTGLGLPTSLRYIEAHGGELRAEPAAAGQGAVFRVQLPVSEMRSP